MTHKRPQSLAEAVAAIGDDREALPRAVAEFLDAFYTHPRIRADAVRQEPARVATIEDAWLAAVAEHLARLWGLDIPDWVEKPHRFLDRAYFAGGLESLKPILLAESPLAFRRRQIFVEAQPLRRASLSRPSAG